MKNLPTDKIISCFYGSSDDCVKVINVDGMLLSINPNGLKVMDIDSERDVLGQKWLTFWQGNMQPKAQAALAKANSGQLAKFEGYCPTYKGRMKYWEVTIAPLFDDFGEISWLLITSRDATKQKKLEQHVKLLKLENQNLQARINRQPAVKPKQRSRAVELANQ